MSWLKHFNTFGIGNLEFMLNPENINLTSSYETSLTIKLNKSYVMRFFEAGFGFDFPICALYDTKYNRMAPNLVSVPYDIPESTNFVTSTKAIIYLEVR